MEELIENKSAILIQARSTSTRLPKKVLLSLTLENQTKTVIEWIYERLRTGSINKIYFIIPDNDTILIKFLQEKNIPFLTGPLFDVRKRYINAAESLKIEYIIRATADNPFVEPELLLPTIKELIYNQFDLFSFIGLPLGVSIEAFTLEAIKKGEQKYNDPLYKEHVSLHIKKHKEIFSVMHKEYLPFKQYLNQFFSKLNAKNFYLPRLTLDQIEDYNVFKIIYSKLKKNFTIYDVMELYFKEPEIFMGNQHVEQRKF
ncbi:MAG: hypothetical protein KatS3mg129_0158 [Leptospiraceae bacterium]|nr:MAG: hypothetical protein KatS3mg129_0158 [Leptospiraceae bacterium]